MEALRARYDELREEYFGRGAYFEDETEAAIEAYEKSLELVPDNAPATQALQRLRWAGL